MILSVSDYNNKPSLKWDNKKDHIYSIYRRYISTTNNLNIQDRFKKISTFDIHDTKTVYDKISVLNLFVDTERTIDFVDNFGHTKTIKENAIFEKWLLEITDDTPQSVSKGRVHIQSISIQEFVNNAHDILYSEIGTAKYDIVYIGVYSIDDISYIEFSENVKDVFEKYINDGYGVLLSSFLISDLYSSDIGFNKLRKYFNIKLGNGECDNDTPDYNFRCSFSSNECYIDKKSSVISYPWQIDSINDNFNIAGSSSLSQFAFGDTYVKLLNPNIVGIDNIPASLVNYGDFYLTINNNCALIQVCDNTDLSIVEKKLICNTIFNLKQNTIKDYFVDVTNFDNVKPLPPTISNNYIDLDQNIAVFELVSDDIGVCCEYYVESIDIINGNTDRSNIITFNHTSGIMYYEYSITAYNDINNQEQCYIKSNDSTIFINNIQPGRYKIEFRCVDYNYNVSNNTIFSLYVPNINNTLSKNVKTYTPNMHRLNHRYRGPHESYKASSFIRQAKMNIGHIYNIVDDIDNKYTSLINNNNVDNYNFIILKKEIRNMIKLIKNQKKLIKCSQNENNSR